MNKTIVKRNIIYYIFVIMISFFIGYFATNVSNTITSTYECKFQTSASITEKDLFSKDNFELAISANKNHSNINTNNLYNENGISFEKIEENTYIITTYARYYDNFFLSSKNIVSTRAKTFLKALISQVSDEAEINYLYADTIELKNHFNEYLGGIIGLIILLPISIILNPLIFKNKNYINEEKKESIFSIQYWKSAKSFLSNPKKISTLSMIFALLLISKMIKIPSGFANLGISFGFIFFSIVGIIYGPLAGITFGLFSDIIGYFLFDTSGMSFSIPYIFQAITSGFIHAIFLYKRKITYTRILCLRITIAIVCNIIIGSICWGIVANYNFEQTISYMLIFSLPKNIVYLIPQSIILFLILKAIIPILSRYKLIDEEFARNVTLY